MRATYRRRLASLEAALLPDAQRTAHLRALTPRIVALLAAMDAREGLTDCAPVVPMPAVWPGAPDDWADLLSSHTDPLP